MIEYLSTIESAFTISATLRMLIFLAFSIYAWYTISLTWGEKGVFEYAVIFCIFCILLDHFRTLLINYFNRINAPRETWIFQVMTFGNVILFFYFVSIVLLVLAVYLSVKGQIVAQAHTQTAQELKQKLARSERVANIYAQALNLAAHDLNTPANGLIGWSDIMSSDVQALHNDPTRSP